MALVLKDRVKETTTTTGTGTLTLLGASTGYQAFSAIGNGNTCYYAISAAGSNQWEVGVGTYTASGTTLSRDTILESSTGGGAIDLAAGTKDVYVVYPAEKGVWLDASGNLVQNQFTSMNVTGTATINVATLTSGTISTAANAATDIVNKAYVDSAVSAGVHFHEPVRVESPTSLNAAYDNGTAGVGATLTNSGANVAIQIDGVSLNVTDRVLVYTQSNATHNGVYVVSTQGAPDSPGPGAKWVLTRSDDTDTYVTDSPDGLSEGSTFFVQQGITGVGTTYTCNTPGTIVFGTTNISFVQVSSAQIYSAGTGLNLNSTTFSIATTGVTAQTYGNAGQVPQIAVNAQGQITSASNVGIAITASNVSGLAASATTDTTNADNITSGTLANARTTASATNGASTIVARDASGNFAAAGITATTFTGDGSLITALNGTAVTTGTVANNRTTAASANGANTIVARDASGNFSANVITADGSALTSLNASNISSGTVPTARLGSGTANNTTFLRGDSTFAVVSSGTLIPTGTVMIFGQTAAPTGFTKLTNQDNAALRVVSGSASTGGSVDFTVAFASQAVSGTVSTSVNNTTATNQNTTAGGTVGVSLAGGGSVSGTTLGISEMPAHSHGASVDGGNFFGPNIFGGGTNFTTTMFTNNTGGGGSHSHGFTNPSYSGSFTGTSHSHTQNAHNHTASSSFTGTAINLAVKYVDVIRATKD